jgi:hypothetical protein
MRYALVLSFAALTGCDQPSSEGLANKAYRLEVLRAQCAADDDSACRAAASAYRRRFFDGTGDPDEYGVLEQLPPIPPTFDSPIDAEPGHERHAAFASEDSR